MVATHCGDRLSETLEERKTQIFIHKSEKDTLKLNSQLHFWKTLPLLRFCNYQGEFSEFSGVAP